MILADQVIKEAGRMRSALQIVTRRNLNELRMSIASARKFVCDETMSEFMAEIASVPLNSVKPERRSEIMEVLRHSARLPFSKTWIEYDEHAFRRGLLKTSPNVHDFSGLPLSRTSLDEIPTRLGWLLEQHPKVDTAVMMTEFVSGDGRFPTFALPYSFVWNTIDEPVPWSCDHAPAEVGHGVVGFVSPFMGVIWNTELKSEHRRTVRHSSDVPAPYVVHYMLLEYAGALRYALSFLATLNDVPTETCSVRPSRGQMVKGNYRRFVDHSVISLKLPQRVNRLTFARKLIALARRRRHEVRGHWRVYQRGSQLCLPSSHEWMAQDERGHARCKNCTAWRTWIEAYDRGDASLGYVTHEYSVSKH